MCVCGGGAAGWMYVASVLPYHSIVLFSRFGYQVSGSWWDCPWIIFYGIVNSLISFLYMMPFILHFQFSAHMNQFVFPTASSPFSLAGKHIRLPWYWSSLLLLHPIHDTTAVTSASVVLLLIEQPVELYIWGARRDTASTNPLSSSILEFYDLFLTFYQASLCPPLTPHSCSWLLRATGWFASLFACPWKTLPQSV